MTSMVALAEMESNSMTSLDLKDLIQTGLETIRKILKEPRQKRGDKGQKNTIESKESKRKGLARPCKSSKKRFKKLGKVSK